MSNKAKKIYFKDIYNTIYYQQPVTKSKLAERLDVSLAAVSSYVNELENSGIISCQGKIASQGGRKPLSYSINPEYRYIIGINLRSSHFYIYLLDLKAELLDSRIIDIESSRFFNYCDSLDQAIRQLLEKNQLEADRIAGIGISLSGITDAANKVVSWSKELDWQDQPLASSLELQLGIPVYVETDVRVYARNTLKPSIKKNDSRKNIAAVIYFSQGIGLALVIHNEILQGYTNRAGDNRFFVSKSGELVDIIHNNEYIKQMNKKPYYNYLQNEEEITRIKAKYQQYVSDNPGIEEELNRYTTRIAEMMTAITNLINPREIFLAGNVFDYNDLIFQEVRDKFADRADQVFHLPEVSRHYEKPLERGIARMIIEKSLSAGIWWQQQNH